MIEPVAGWHEIATRATGPMRVILDQDTSGFIMQHWWIIWPIERTDNRERGGIRFVISQESLMDNTLLDLVGYEAVKEAHRCGAILAYVPDGQSFASWRVANLIQQQED